MNRPCLACAVPASGHDSIHCLDARSSSQLGELPDNHMISAISKHEDDDARLARGYIQRSFYSHRNALTQQHARGPYPALLPKAAPTRSPHFASVRPWRTMPMRIELNDARMP